MADSIEQLQRDFATLGGTLKRGVLRLAASAGANLIKNEAQQRVPKRTSTLARSIQQKIAVSRAELAVAEIGPSVEYGRYVEEGTGVHGPKKQPIVIEPVKARALRWMTAQGISVSRGGKVRKSASGDRFAFAKRVVVQGSRPQPYMVPAFEAKADEASLEATDVIWNQVRAVMAR